MYGDRQAFGSACCFCQIILMNPEQRQVLVKTGELLNGNHITWGVGASMLLAQYGLAENPADIDIVVALEDIETVDSLLSSLGTIKKQKEKSDIYLTDFFYEYVIDTVEIDVMAGFKIKLPDSSVFDYKFDKESIPHTFEIDGTYIPFMSLEEWYVLYQLMPNREYKADLLEGYFEKQGVEYPRLLEKYLQKKTLPKRVKDKIGRLFS